MSTLFRSAASRGDRIAAVERARIQLGQALLARMDDLVAEMAADTQLPAKVRDAFDRAAHTSTPAVAAWIAGGDITTARVAGERTTAAFGELAARLDAPLPLVIKRVLVWRDRLEEELVARAKCLDSPPEALDGALRMLRRSADVTMVGIAKAFEQERQRAAATVDTQRHQLHRQATHDALTGLINRDVVLERLQSSLATGSATAVVVIDLDNFRYVNDSHGHRVGDLLLQEMAERLRDLVEPPDLVGRLGGDEFVVVISNVNADGSDHGRLREVLTRPLMMSGRPGYGIRMTASVGVAIANAGSATELIRRGEVAMYVAKSRGRDQLVTYEFGLDGEAHTRLETEQALRIAADRDEFEVWYQPIFDLTDIRIVSAEALLRWQHPTRGLVGPADFVPLLEDTGLIVDVGRKVVRQACFDCAKIRASGHDIGVAVNVSPVQLRNADFGHEFLDVLRDVDLPAGATTIEITEAAVVAEADQVSDILRGLRAEGVRVALDDFGIGYSSLAQLRSLPIDVLKVDKSFVTGLYPESNGDAFIEVISALARALSLTTVAEGIENLPQLESLRRHGYTHGQGYLLAAPMRSDAFLDVLANGDIPVSVEQSRFDQW